MNIIINLLTFIYNDATPHINITSEVYVFIY